MRLYIVRHGETDWNRAGRFQGQLDFPLNDAGRAQAEQAAEKFRGLQVEAVYSSPQIRALETARLIASAAGCAEIHTDRDFMEICHGDWEGLTLEQAQSDDPELFAQWLSCPHLMKMPGAKGESLQGVFERASSAVERIIKKHRGNVILVTHGVVVQTLICHFLDVPLSECWHIEVPNCSVRCIEGLPGDPKMISDDEKLWK